MKIGEEQIRLLNALETVSGVNAKDCIVDSDIVSFLVPENDVGKAIGKNAANVKKLNASLGKKIEILPYTPDFKGFLKGAMKEVKFEKISIEESSGEKQALVSLDPENRRKMLGKGRKLKRVKKIAQRNYKIGGLRFG